jgi:hypothetical protein
MLAQIAFTLGFGTWREAVVGLKTTEMVHMELRRTWDVQSKNIPNTKQDILNRPIRPDLAAGGTSSESLGFVRWRMKDTVLFNKPMKNLVTESYDKKTGVLTIEEVWATTPGDIVRQREERRTQRGTETADAAFYEDRVELTRVGIDGNSTFAALYPAGGMSEVQKRFKPMTENKKEFLQLDAIKGSFRKVKIERAGRFKGTWAGEKYDGPCYRFTVDGKEQTLMMTTDDETVQVSFTSEIQLVLSDATKSRRKGG